MRSSQKNRNSRNKGGRNKSSGNVLNRVYESAGPEGKVRGTPQQVIDKYLLLARDAQTSGDRVMAENFLQHAEHYIRLLNAAMPQQTEDRRQPYGNGAHAETEQGEGQADQSEAHGDGLAGEPQGQEEDRREDVARPARAVQPTEAKPSPQKGEGETSSGLETIDVGSEDDTEVVETPENKAAAETKTDETKADAEEEPKPKPRRRTRRPRNADEVAAE
jgi:hypothetical protein